MRVYVDTSGLFAAIVSNDVNHSLARPTLAALIESHAALHTSSYTLLETLALLQARVGLDAAAQVEHTMRPLLHVHWMTEPLHERAFRRLELRRRRKLSLVDCAGFVVMEERAIQTAFAYDDDFAQEGFTLLESVDQIES
jgi:predicted nucleic acid-binding protein